MGSPQRAVSDDQTLALQQQIVRLQALLEASRKIHSTIHLDEVLRRALEIVVRELEMEGAFFIATIYKPAQEVGGDFFQVIPVAGGSLVVIGDVSGKGLQAAMTVSLIVGAIRILAEYTQQPAELLNSLNQTLLGRGGGFTTCLVARICANGDVMIANAGHLPPYQGGNELVTASDLPLGISGDVEYGESALQLEPGSRLTFISDGVVEAKDSQKQLFGFERARAISSQSAQAVADAAVDFGQEDDITVVTIQRAVAAYA